MFMAHSKPLKGLCTSPTRENNEDRPSYLTYKKGRGGSGEGPLNDYSLGSLPFSLLHSLMFVGKTKTSTSNRKKYHEVLADTM
jgi:hypothetical protein